MKLNNHWPGLGVSDAELEKKAVWISRDHPHLTGSAVMYFRTAGSLIRFSKYDFTLLPLALLQVVIGLEKTLRLHYQDEDTAFKELLTRAVSDGMIADDSFSRMELLPKEFGELIGNGWSKYTEKFATLIPALRNEFFHGTYSLQPAFLPLALHVREAVDALLLARSLPE